jgi:hypothetical protein
MKKIKIRLILSSDKATQRKSGKFKKFKNLRKFLLTKIIYATLLYWNCPTKTKIHFFGERNRSEN